MKRPLLTYYDQIFINRDFVFRGTWIEMTDRLEKNDLLFVYPGRSASELHISGHIFFLWLARNPLFHKVPIRLLLKTQDVHQLKVRLYATRLSLWHVSAIIFSTVLIIGSTISGGWREIACSILLSAILLGWFHFISRTEENVLVEEIESCLDLTEDNPPGSISHTKSMT
ncbi:MAG: hypothetical protein JNL17_00975 [Cyclobacteriaceae bacterium]|nr:hypothetical protein [Cyclobacteriaceae bacterium]